MGLEGAWELERVCDLEDNALGDDEELELCLDLSDGVAGVCPLPPSVFPCSVAQAGMIYPGMMETFIKTQQNRKRIVKRMPSAFFRLFMKIPRYSSADSLQINPAECSLLPKKEIVMPFKIIIYHIHAPMQAKYGFFPVMRKISVFPSPNSMRRH